MGPFRVRRHATHVFPLQEELVCMLRGPFSRRGPVTNPPGINSLLETYAGISLRVRSPPRGREKKKKLGVREAGGGVLVLKQIEARMRDDTPREQVCVCVCCIYGHVQGDVRVCKCEQPRTNPLVGALCGVRCRARDLDDKRVISPC